MNRYGHCWPQDFKSCVSTNSTTRAPKKIHPEGWTLRAEDEIRTRDPNLGKVVLYQLSYFRVCKNFGVAKIRETLYCNKKILNYLYFGVYWVLS